MQRVASCSCGGLTATCQGDPELVALCHCTACQKRTGAPYGIAAFYRRSSVGISGQHSSYERSSDSGFGIVFHFCATCGSTVFWEPARKPDMIAIGVGSFADPGFPGPSKEVHTEDRHRWIAPLGSSRD